MLEKNPSPEQKPQEKSPEKSSDKKELYKKLLEKRALERHQQAMESGRKEVIDGERIDWYKKRIEELEKIWQETLGAGIGQESTSEDLTRDDLTFLQAEINRLEKEIAELAEPEEVEKLRAESYRRLLDFMRKIKRLSKGENDTNEDLRKMMKDYQRETRELRRRLLIQLIAKYQRTLEEFKNKRENELPFRNPESFLAHCLLRLREFKKQLPSGIVETKYPRGVMRRAMDLLVKNRLVALVGETGTGKTRLAKKIAEQLSGDYVFIAGHKFTTKEDLFYYYGIDVSKVSPEEIPKKIKETQSKFREAHSNWSEEEIEEALKTIEEVIKGQASNPQLVTKEFLSGVLRAAQEGKIVIVDEFNYINPGLLAGLNALIEAQPGQEISVLGQKITVKEGFGVILTGNITRADFQGRYLQREKLDPALVNRLNSGLIEYGSLPQAQIAFEESILSQDEFRKGEKVPSRELFQIGLAILVDEKGNLSGPRDLLEKTWKLSSEFSLLQKLYAGEELETPVKLPGGQDVVLKEYAISNRTFRAVLEGWHKDNYRYSIDWYIYDNLIRPAAAISPSEAGQIFTLLKERGGFFQDESWEVLKVSPTTWKIEGIEEIERDRENFLKTQELKEPVYYFTPQEVAEAFSGIKMPELTDIALVREEVRKKEFMEKYQELKEEYEGIKGFLENWEETIDLYCQDEENIKKSVS